MYSSLIQKFNTISTLSSELETEIRRTCKIIKVKKKEFLLTEGDICQNLYFINSGVLRAYYVNQDGQEKTSWLLVENDIVISVYSFFTGKPTLEYLQAIENCELLTLSKKRLEVIYERYPEFNYIGRKLTEAYYIRKEEQAIALRTLSAKERYEHLMRKEGHLINRVPLGYIASYLGMKQETLSRIRKL